ncbi:E1a [Simian adenovirus 49]|uniref:Early E1A protein n=2 Tax=Simian mastadenovirus B TaxID=1962299 RepID=F2WTM8_9ADEN|nr:E1a [Simian adenovirus 49]ADZ39831.1 E1a [Simian adenovirus 49]ADZ39863.1 E1a [Simian adenovirus 50]
MKTWGLDCGLYPQEVDEWLRTEYCPTPGYYGENLSLHDLYDIDVDAPADGDENEVPVNDFFPDSLLLAVDEGIEVDYPPPLDTPGEPSGSHFMPDLSAEEVDLYCHEDGFPPSDSEGEQSEAREERLMAEAAATGAAAAARRAWEEEEFRLDCPVLPGHGCASCDYHRKTSGFPEIMCSLCYLRAHGMFVYSPVSDAEGEPDSTTGHSGGPGSPPKLHNTPPRNVPRPVPLRVSGVRRAAVESLHDLIGGEEEQVVPLDLSAKRPRH